MTDEVNDGQPATPAPGTPEHDAAMAAKYIDANTPAPAEGTADEAPAGEQPTAAPKLTIEQEAPAEEG